MTGNDEAAVNCARRADRTEHPRMDAARVGGEHRGGGIVARVDRGELDAQARQGGARGGRLALAARGQLALVVELRVVRDGFPVAEEPELLGHIAEPNRGRGTARSA